MPASNPRFDARAFDHWCIATQGRYRYYRLPVSAQNAALASHVLAFCDRQRRRLGYRGHPPIEPRCHRSGVYCFAAGPDGPVQAARIEPRLAGTLPMETGRYRDGASPSVSDARIAVELSAITLDPAHFRHTGASFWALLADYLLREGIEQAWTLVDRDDPIAQRIYRHAGWQPSAAHRDALQLDGVSHQRGPGSVWWHIWQLGADALARHAAQRPLAAPSQRARLADPA